MKINETDASIIKDSLDIAGGESQILHNTDVTIEQFSDFIDRMIASFPGIINREDKNYFMDNIEYGKG